MTAICIRCGASRADFREICASCGHRPEDEGLLVAWLFSEENITKEELEAAAARIRAGESIRPSDRMLERARRALGRDLSTDPGLTTNQRIALLATSLFLTPLVGLVMWFWWRQERPRAALQALGLSLPATVFFTSVVLWSMLGS